MNRNEYNERNQQERHFIGGPSIGGNKNRQANVGRVPYLKLVLNFDALMAHLIAAFWPLIRGGRLSHDDGYTGMLLCDFPSKDFLFSPPLATVSNRRMEGKETKVGRPDGYCTGTVRRFLLCNRRSNYLAVILAFHSNQQYQSCGH